MRISDWSSDVCSSDLTDAGHVEARPFPGDFGRDILENALGASFAAGHDLRAGVVHVVAGNAYEIGDAAVAIFVGTGQSDREVRRGNKARSEERGGGKEGVRQCR